MLAAKHRNHLKNENLETLFLLTALKLVAKKFFEYEQEIKLIERKLTFTTILVNFPLNLFFRTF